MNLSQQITKLLKQATAELRASKSVRKDPRDAHDAEVRSKELERKAKELISERDDNLTLARSIRASVTRFEHLPLKSAARSTAMRKLREAAMWLEEEAGPEE